MTAVQTPAASNRLNSIDFMRAFIVFIMIFVNDLATVTGLPFWAYHMVADTNGITPVDTLFAFLIPELVYSFFGTSFFAGTVFSEGLLGVVRSLLFTFFMLAIIGLLTKAKIRLKL